VAGVRAFANQHPGFPGFSPAELEEHERMHVNAARAQIALVLPKATHCPDDETLRAGVRAFGNKGGRGRRAPLTTAAAMKPILRALGILVSPPALKQAERRRRN
jgi:hypothetical protein